jgi:hypothetical protein
MRKNKIYKLYSFAQSMEESSDEIMVEPLPVIPPDVDFFYPLDAEQFKIVKRNLLLALSPLSLESKTLIHRKFLDYIYQNIVSNKKRLLLESKKTKENLDSYYIQRNKLIRSSLKANPSPFSTEIIIKNFLGLFYRDMGDQKTFSEKIKEGLSQE